MARRNNYEHNPGTDAAGSRDDDETAVRPKREGHNYPQHDDTEYLLPSPHDTDPLKDLRRDVDLLISRVNQLVRLLRNWVNVYDPELMIENLQEIPTDELPS